MVHSWADKDWAYVAQHTKTTPTAKTTTCPYKRAHRANSQAYSLEYANASNYVSLLQSPAVWIPTSSNPHKKFAISETIWKNKNLTGISNFYQCLDILDAGLLGWFKKISVGFDEGRVLLNLGRDGGGWCNLIIRICFERGLALCFRAKVAPRWG